MICKSEKENIAACEENIVNCDNIYIANNTPFYDHNCRTQ